VSPAQPIRNTTKHAKLSPLSGRKTGAPLFFSLQAFIFCFIFALLTSNGNSLLERIIYYFLFVKFFSLLLPLFFYTSTYKMTVLARSSSSFFDAQHSRHTAALREEIFY
jgi:hypothetical protein